jgi:hypothetical protein
VKREEPRPFYSILDQLPPLGVPVLVLWDGRGPFEAARVAHPRTKQTAWAAKHDGETVLLPVTDRAPDPARPWSGWHTLKGDAPNFWSPKHHDKWGLRLPDVALMWNPNEPTRMWNAKQSFDAVAAADEMEADREAARSGAPRVAAGSTEESRNAPRRILWWLDASQVRYSTTGKVTKREAEARIMRALAGDEWLRGSEGLGMHRGKSADELRAMAEADASALPEFNPPFEPLPADRADYDIAMQWFAALGFLSRMSRPITDQYLSEHQAVLALASRTRVMSFSEISVALGMKRQATQTLHRIALERVWAIANGFADAGAIARDEAMARVRNSNKQARLARADR